MKRLSILLLSVLCTAATTFAYDYDFQSGDLYYNITSDTTVKVTYQESSETNYQGLTTATIPATVTNDGTTYSVTSIGDFAFVYCSSLTSITIPNSVTSIGSAAFIGCSALPMVDNLRYADTYLVEAVDNSLSTYTIKAGTKWIGDYAFGNCSSLTSITIPNSVTSIGEQAFSGCSSLTSITIPNSVTSIGARAFYGCSSLTSITIPNSVTSIEYMAFGNCSSLTSVTIPNSVTSIGDHAFSGCSALTSISIPNSVVSIGSAAFADCSSLTSLTIPNSVTSIEYGAFYGCSSLTSVVWNAKNCAVWSFSYDGLPFYDIRSNITSFTFGEEVETIPSDLCYGMSALTSITIPNSVTSIGYEAFYKCSSLTSISIPNSVTSIGSSAFSGCSALTSVVWNAKNCAGWSSSYYAPPFYDIRSNITSFTFGEEVETIPSDLCYGMSALTSITIPNSVTSIGSSAFSGCSALTSISIPNSVTSIRSSAFSGCSALTSIVWNAKNCGGWGSYDYAPFYDICSNITSFTFGDEVETIPSYLCYGMSSLTSITIPNSVTSIGEEVLAGCDSLTSIVVESGNTIYDSRDNCNAIIETASNTLIAGCQSTIIPNSVTSIGGYAFEYCSSITSITIPNSVTSIGDKAFWNCSHLTSIIIGNSVEYIGDDAFCGCSALADIYCYATTPPECYEDRQDPDENPFYSVSKHCYIHVPAGTIREYQMAEGWRDFYHFYEISELPDGTPTDQVGVTVTGNYATFSWPVNPTASSYTLTITKDGEVFCTLIFNNMGQLVGMAFAPARDGKPSATQSDAQSTAYGFSFVVTNLDANSHYTYTFTVNGADSEVIETYSGSFDTSEETALPATTQEQQPSRKIIHNGQVLILRNGETYDMMGQRL